MKIFNYSAKALDGKSKSQEGAIEAIDLRDAEQKIKKMFAYPVLITLSELQMELVESPATLTTLEEGGDVQAVATFAVMSPSGAKQ